MKNKAFTLIELLVVVSIIALLISILLPSLSSAREQAQRVKCGSHMHQTGIGLASYSSDYRQMLPVRGGYMYNLKETNEYHFPKTGNAAFDKFRSNVNIGGLFPKYCAGDGVFYYCPANLVYLYDSTANGWPTFKADYAPPGPGVTWAGYSYAIPVLPGHHPKDDGKLSYKPVSELCSTGAPAHPDVFGGLYNSDPLYGPSYARYPDDPKIMGYISLALRQGSLRYSSPYLGRNVAILTDIILGGKSHKNKGFNVMFTDYHTRWVPDKITFLKVTAADEEGKAYTLQGPLSVHSATSGKGGFPVRMGMWNVLSKKP
jgi:prepilin-type N-terminal cleavage/methylation domain-containing protein